MSYLSVLSDLWRPVICVFITAETSPGHFKSADAWPVHYNCWWCICICWRTACVLLLLAPSFGHLYSCLSVYPLPVCLTHCISCCLSLPSCLPVSICPPVYMFLFVSLLVCLFFFVVFFFVCLFLSAYPSVWTELTATWAISINNGLQCSDGQNMCEYFNFM